MIQVFFLSFNRAQIETIGRLTAVFLGSFVSPSWLLLKQAMYPFLDLDLLLKKDIGLGTFVQMVGQLQSFGPEALLYKLIPSIFLCGVASCCFFLLCSFVGKYAARVLMDRYSVPAA